jgi:4-hydroxyphenylpyruvate dioxygenase
MSEDPVPIKAIHHVELWVGNAKQSAYYYRKAFGFSQIAVDCVVSNTITIGI